MKEAIETVGVVVFEGDRVLLVKNTSLSQHKEGVYGLPAGRVESGEYGEMAARRELQEETGLEAINLVKLPKQYEAELERKGGEWVLMRMVVFMCLEYSGKVAKTEETIPVWVRDDQISKLPLNPNTEMAVQQARNYLDNLDGGE